MDKETKKFMMSVLKWIGIFTVEEIIIMTAYYKGFMDGSTESIKDFIRRIKEEFPDLYPEKNRAPKYEDIYKKRKHLYIIK